MIKHSKYYYDKDRNMPVWKLPEGTKFEWHLDKVLERIGNLLKEKNRDYGDSALNPLNVFSKLDAVESLCCRLDDKIARIRNKGINDKTEDTVDDLIGYLLLLKMAMEKKQRDQIVGGKL
jgi:hypothetical protein|tara:strand:+ start:2179 stop:2538 length:360 start_codon:yes stop_codon:yes gene_type:complete